MVAIGNSNLDIFPLALGGNTFGWTSDETSSFEILDAFTAGGGNFIDTADSYSAFADGNSGGESETIIGNWTAARGNRDDVVIATKVSQHPEFRGLAPANVKAAAEASLKRLQSDHIDVYYAHYDDENTPLVETLAAFDELVKDGKVRYVAISNYSPDRIREWLSLAEQNGFSAPVALQPHYNLVTRREYETELASLAADNNLGVFPYFSLAAGFLTGKYRTREDLEGQARQKLASGYFTDEGLNVVDALSDIADAHDAEISSVALAWLLAQPTVTAPIASASKITQLPALLAAPALTLSTDEVARLTEVSDRI
ncbi:aldo/keto reductase [Rhodococcus sp. BP-252]|uniref:aldo/keto reductase n=1 Tax=unclassified Rhodococcus (in: high G+C Gram-positive bacteria) TaxID=192944 RepID=UPI001431E897|nr:MULTISPECIES: aldo/keto reductase [unclassified Rhodococcus (in: high G+C Gram-positive bacteria)]NIL76486.1 Aldo-keto reductase IolS [Rhodococcus sp. B10]MBY6414725.1 aldo/keto reductase [Rhodococcus sp. BP-320]MBY6419629.1 aldo/keto reductase [Rhodococcus sp. BP-321]MBY6424596.1 aldo/keto reductase [Rhodococcus sp. BP-324]MBY6429593.1 aldo/keto reductase [Rhodococcus sp. BP-323]